MAKRKHHNPLAGHARILADKLRASLARAMHNNRCPVCGSWLVRQGGSMDCADPQCSGFAGVRAQIVMLDREARS